MQGRRKLPVGVVDAVMALVILVFSILLIEGYKEAFDPDTTINGTDCSFLKVKFAKEKIEEELRENISFQVLTSSGEVKQYKPAAEESKGFEFQIEAEDLENILQIQKQDRAQKEFSVPFSVNEEGVRSYLKTIPELKEEQVLPQDAYLRVSNKNLLEVVPEVRGNQTDFEEVCSFAVKALEAGEKEVDFKEITKVLPEIISTDEELRCNQDEVNRILGTTIELELKNGEFFTLDSSIMKEWLQKTDGGLYKVNIEDNLPQFIAKLSEKVNELEDILEFEATDLGRVSVLIPENKKAVLDEEEELRVVKEHLEKAESCKLELIYIRKPLEYLMTNYIEVDRGRQTVWVYQSDKNILEADCVTGDVAAGHNTPLGIYYLDYKKPNTTLTDNATYWSYVNYWMKFNGGIGFHDALWRYDKNGVGHFGGDIYKTDGSHGCVNMPIDAAETLYEFIDSTMPIIIYDSSEI